MMPPAPDPSEPAIDSVLAFAHIGDLNLTDAKQRSYVDFRTIVAQIETGCAGVIDYVVLPGDNADNGLPAQYARAATGQHAGPCPAGRSRHGARQPRCLLCGVSGRATAQCRNRRGPRCLFLDISGPGSGGPDFLVRTSQTAWLGREPAAAHAQGQTSVLFMQPRSALAENGIFGTQLGPNRNGRPSCLSNLMFLRKFSACPLT